MKDQKYKINILKILKKKYKILLRDIINNLNDIRIRLNESIITLDKLNFCKDEYYKQFNNIVYKYLNNQNMLSYNKFLESIYNMINYQNKYIDSLNSNIIEKLKELEKIERIYETYNIIFKKSNLDIYNYKIKRNRKQERELLIKTIIYLK